MVILCIGIVSSSLIMSGRLAVVGIALLQLSAVYAQEHKYPVEDAVSKGLQEDLRDSLCQYQNGGGEYKPASARVRATLQLLREGDQKIQISNNHTHAVLVLGNSGAGKSTFTQWMSGNPELEAQETAENDETYIIVDKHGKISNSTIDSKTIFPELVIDNISNTYFYDYPGFSDTRGSHNDIATSYFINKVLEHVDAVKLVFTVNYPSVVIGLDRQDFLKLLKHATELVKDIDKYKESIALVVTKVDNQYIKRGHHFTFVEDEQVITRISNFLEEAKLSLKNRVLNFENTVKDSKFNEDSLKFIDILLSKNGNRSTKIGIFRRPEDPGLISNSFILNKEKNHIKHILQTLNFTQMNIKDFGYTLSEKSLVEIYDLVEEINRNISSSLNCAFQKLHIYYSTLGKIADAKIASFDVNSYTDWKFVSVKIYFDKITEVYNVLKNMVYKIRNIENVKDFTNILLDKIPNLDALNSTQRFISDISMQSKYLEFLQTFIGDNSYKKTITTSWVSIFEEFLNELFEMKNGLEDNLKSLEGKINKKMENDIENIQKSVTKHLIEKENCKGRNSADDEEEYFR